MYDQLERYRRRFVVYTDIDPTIAEEHKKIMELALARDTAACKVLKQHFEHAARVIGGMMEKTDAGGTVSELGKSKAIDRVKLKRTSARVA